MVPDDESVGGGAGGGPAKPECADQDVTAIGTYKVTGNRVELLARPPDPPNAPDPPSVITLFASGLGVDGLANVRGTQGVRVTSGPLPPVGPAVESESTNGVEIIVGEPGTVTLKRGFQPPAIQKIEMTQTGITIDAGVGKVTIESLTEIELSVAGGLSKIKLGPEGVTIEGLIVKLDATIQAKVQAIIATLTADALNQISGGITMIG